MKWENEDKTQRVVTFLTREQVDLLDKLGKDALFSTGYKLSRNKILGVLVEFLKDIQIDTMGIKDEGALRETVWKAFEKKVKDGFTSPTHILSKPKEK